MTPSNYLDIRNLDWSSCGTGSCPVSNCAASLGLVASQRGDMPHCPDHQIRIHRNSRTFVYYHGSDPASRRQAALRNILFAREYFGDHILGNAAKAESHRIAHETSEDALTWNVFSGLLQADKLGDLLTTLRRGSHSSMPELYLWGLRVDPHAQSAPAFFPALRHARDRFEKGIKQFLTEPDIMLYVPGKVLVLIEAKFTSGNTIAKGDDGHETDGEKPKTRQGLLRRYSPEALSGIELKPADPSLPFYSQLYRNLVFAIYMAEQLGVDWRVVSLVSETQCKKGKKRDEYRDPTSFIHAMLPAASHHRFVSFSWEELYRSHLAGAEGLPQLAEYLVNKSANGSRAFDL